MAFHVRMVRGGGGIERDDAIGARRRQDARDRCTERGCRRDTVGRSERRAERHAVRTNSGARSDRVSDVHERDPTVLEEVCAERPLEHFADFVRRRCVECAGAVVA